MKSMLFPCINSLEGCSGEFSMQEMKNHEEVCIEQKFSCPICEMFETSSYALNIHCKTFHKNNKLEIMGFPINLNQGNSRHVYFYQKNKMLLFISFNYEEDINKIKINISLSGNKYNGDILQSISLYTINHELKYKTQIKPCLKLNSIDSEGFTVDVSQLNFTKKIVLCEFIITEKPILGLVEKPLVIDPMLDNFIARCKFDNISQIVEKIYFPAVYYFSDITWKVFIDVVDNHVEVGLRWGKTNNSTSKLDFFCADVTLTLLSSKKKLSKRLKEICLQSSNVLKFKFGTARGTIFNVASRKRIIQNDSINIEVKVNIYLHMETNKQCENPCSVHCTGTKWVHWNIRKISGDGKWCKFEEDDDLDSRCTNGHDEDINIIAYMLAYVKDSLLLDVLQEVTDADIPSKLIKEKRMEQVEQKERDQADLYMTVQVLLEDQFNGHQGNDLYDPKLAQFRKFKILKRATVAQMMEMLADHFKYPVEQIRPWPFFRRSNETIRPGVLDIESDLHQSVIDVAESVNPWNIFLELLPLNSDRVSLPPFDEESDVLLFFKMYDPEQKMIHYCGHLYVPVCSTLNDIIPVLKARAGFAPDTKLLLYEELKPNKIERLTNFNEAIEQISDELMDGDIIIFERDDASVNSDLPTCIDYYKDVFYGVEVKFVNKAIIPNDQGIKMELSYKMTYDQFARAIAQKVGTDPHYLKFFRCQSDKDGPGRPVKWTFEGTLIDLLVSNKQRKIFYQQLSVPIDLENRKQFKCIYVDSNMKDKELILYPKKDGTVGDLLKEAKKQIEFSEFGSRKLRFLEIYCDILLMGPKEYTPLELLFTTKKYRVEEIPREELLLAEDEMLVSCVFHNSLLSPLGNPFLIKVKDGESFSRVKERIQRKLSVPEEEWVTFQFAIFRERFQMIILNDNYVVDLLHFKPIRQSK